MREVRNSFISALALGIVFSATNNVAASEALAYIGPGGGLGMIGALLAVLAFIILALLGPILYPIRLIRRWMRSRAEVKETPAEAETATQNEVPS